jgi:hypothetical protein
MLKKFLKAKPEVVSALIFVNDPHRVEIIYEKLLEMGFVAAPLHGESSKDDRKVFLLSFYFFFFFFSSSLIFLLSISFFFLFFVIVIVFLSFRKYFSIVTFVC